jgi:ribosomal-protein-alanine N-acetyltransferase
LIDLPIKTERLHLRNFRADDWLAVHSYASDPEVVRFVEWGPNTEDVSQNFVQRVIQLSQADPRVDFELAIVLSDENILVGAASIHVSHPANQEGWIGYCLNRQFWGRGIASEAADALISFGFSALQLKRIYATVDPQNAASAGVLSKARMSYEGRLRSHKNVRGNRRDTDMYAIIESDWLSKSMH